MKALKIIGAIFATILVAVAIFYVGWMRPPSPESVCDNLARIMKKEANVEMSEKDRASCIRQMGTPPQFGRVPWVKQLKCIRDAETSKDLDACKGPTGL